jgi:DNA polymerase I
MVQASTGKSSIIIDANNLCHISMHALGELSFNEQSTGIIFGFFRQILSLAKLYKTNNLIFCWDSRKSKRRLIYPEYKRGRQYMERTPEQQLEYEAMMTQFGELRQTLLAQVGFKNNFVQTGYEADDLIADIVLRNNHSFVVVSTDNDLFQLLDHCKLHNPISKKVTTRAVFEEKYGVTPKQWPEVKALAGCSSDNVKGFPGVGEITAIKYLTKGLKRAHKLTQIMETQDAQASLAFNRTLVTLPFPGLKPPILQDGERFDLEAFEHICHRYDMQYFLKNLRAWEDVFSVNINHG